MESLRAVLRDQRKLGKKLPVQELFSGNGVSHLFMMSAC